jgi:hypothetical protein
VKAKQSSETASCKALNNAKIAGYQAFSPLFKAEHIMDAEQINTIGSKLTDLAARTLDLRGYL